MTDSRKPLPLSEARTQLWKAVADNKPTHVANLLGAYPKLTDGQIPAAAIPDDGTAALGWYGRALSQLPLLNRAKETQELYERGLGTLQALKDAGMPFQGMEDFADSLVARKLLGAPNSPYGEWFINNKLVSMPELLNFVVPPEPARARRPGPGL
jgi:hypothetical protein